MFSISPVSSSVGAFKSVELCSLSYNSIIELRLMASTLMSRKTYCTLRVLGVIPARGGSKSIRKNIVDVGGVCDLHTIEAAHKANLIDSCIVSTDSKEIAFANLWCRSALLRPDELSTDVAGSCVVIHALEFMENMNNNVYMPLSQPTTPRKTS